MKTVDTATETVIEKEKPVKMVVKNKNPAKFLKGKTVDPIIKLLFHINHLKQIYRQGPLRHGVKKRHCESDAEHVNSMSSIARFLCDMYYPHLDKERVLTMIDIHEFGEIVIGDPPSTDDPLFQRFKHHVEKQAVEDLLKDIPTGHKYIAIWKEYVKQETAEARFVKDLDKFEMVCQAKIYALQHRLDMSEFYLNATKHIKSKPMRRLLRELLKL